MTLKEKKYGGLLAVVSTEADVEERGIIANGLYWLFENVKPNLIVTGSTNKLVGIAEVYKQVMIGVEEVKMSSSLNPQAMEPFLLKDAVESLAPLLEQKYMGVVILAHPAIASDLMGSLHVLTNHYLPMSDHLAMAISNNGDKYVITREGRQKDLRG